VQFLEYRWAIREVELSRRLTNYLVLLRGGGLGNRGTNHPFNPRHVYAHKRRVVLTYQEPATIGGLLE